MSIPPYMPVKLEKELGQAEDYGEVREGILSSCQDIDVLKRDRFELLSAYLDGEVTPDERRMVLNWMNSDPQAKCLYNRLMCLRQGFREGSHGQSCDADVAIDRVFQCLNYRMKLVGMAGLGVFVLGVLSMLSGGLGSSPGIWRWAAAVQSESLEIALDQPAFPIPKAPVEATATLGTSFVDGESVLPIESEL
jgi:hypothetical protein